MADDEWDAEDFEPKPVVPGIPIVDKWVGEDEEEDVKDNWEDDEEEEGSEEGSKKDGPPKTADGIKAVEVKQKNEKRKKIAERERKEREEAEKLREEEEQQQAVKKLTPEEQYAEKLKRQQLQEESDLALAKETFGLSSPVSSTGQIESLVPDTKGDFDELRRLLVEKVQKSESHDLYGDFVEELVSDLCITLPSVRLKRLKMTVESLQQEKSKSEKQFQKKGQKPGKAKAKLHVEGQTFLAGDLDGSTYNEYEDFM